MPCFHPVDVWKSRKINPETGKYPIVHNGKLGQRGSGFKRPCGQCIGCRLEKSRQWAVRASLESSLYERNCFLTLTYSPEHLPAHGFLDYQAPVEFMWRLRNKFGSGIRSFGCAEYGEQGSRPHYHLCLFNHDFEDKVLFKKERDFELFTSPVLSELWPFGHSTIGSLTFESAAYVARYCTKKVTGKKALEAYRYVTSSGQVLQRPPERTVCVSRMPGLGKPWLDRFASDVYPHDSLHTRGVRQRPPLYFDRIFALDHPHVMEVLKHLRRCSGEASSHRDFVLRGQRNGARVKEKCLELKFKLLKRGIEIA